MKRISISICALALLFSLTGCSNAKESEPAGNIPTVSGSSSAATESSSAAPESSSTTPGSSSAAPGSSSATSQQSSATPQSTGKTSSTKPVQSSADPVQTRSTQTNTSSKPVESSQSSNEKEKSEYMMNIRIGDKLLTATLEHNSSTDALLKMLADGPVTVHMSDYAGMEKVGTLPKSLPRNDKHIDTNACDLILYQGDQFVIYYDTNSWSLTRLGKINNVTQSELKKILGTGDVTATLSRP